ncbi:DUF1778 domain-containing protein [Photorhabdus khanii]|uniref:DUF1778 domain-containing protein n=1 Tax=Photorhabdus khanii TaxID=1004150 RepID=A0A7C9GPM7_9GAMM|nr:DUF1778 domain-containing protein [Photorhabdus khanii]
MIHHTIMYIQQIHRRNLLMSKIVPINMRAEPIQHALLTKTAALLHKDRSTFILDVAYQEAENINHPNTHSSRLH